MKRIAAHYLSLTLISIAALAFVLSAGRVEGHDHGEPHHQGCDTGAGEACFYAFIDDYHTIPATTDATGEVFLALNHDRTEIRYTIVLDDLLGLKPNPAERTEPDDIIGMHLHLHVPGAIGPHVLNIFGLPAEEDADLVVDYANHTLSGVYDISDATIDPATGQPALQFYPLTTKIIDDWIDDLMAGYLMIAVHTNESGFGTMAIHGHISPEEHSVPELSGAALFLVGMALSIITTRNHFGFHSDR
jgi:hypothetical protein